MGVPLAIACRVGRMPKREPSSLWFPLLKLSVVSFAVATIAGLVGWVAASNGWVFLLEPIASRVPEDRHVPFLVDLWIHNASYLVGFVGAIFLIVLILVDRKKRSEITESS